MQLFVGKDYEDMSLKAAKHFIKKWSELKVLGLATGSTPLGLYKELIAANKDGDISFSSMKTINLDEYIGLPKGHKESYRTFMNEHLFEHVDIDINNTYVPKAEGIEDAAACLDYDMKIDSLGGVDIQVLGVGENGHIAFNEPANEIPYGTNIVKLTESTIAANARFFDSIDDVPRYAITMGIGKIMEAKEIVLLANGKKKADAMRQLIRGNTVTTSCPVTLLKLHPRVFIFTDEELMEAL